MLGGGDMGFPEASFLACCSSQLVGLRFTEKFRENEVESSGSPEHWTLAHGGVFFSQHTRVCANEKMFRRKCSPRQISWKTLCNTVNTKTKIRAYKLKYKGYPSTKNRKIRAIEKKQSPKVTKEKSSGKRQSSIVKKLIKYNFIFSWAWLKLR